MPTSAIHIVAVQLIQGPTYSREHKIVPVVQHRQTEDGISKMNHSQILPTSSTAYNSSTDANAGYDYDGLMAHAVIPIYSTVFTVGLCGNVLVACVMMKYIKLKTVPNVFIFSLALADLLSMMGIPLMAYALVSPNWQLGGAVCKILLSVDGLNQFTGIYILTTMTLDRYLAIVHPMTTTNIRTPTKAKWITLLVWLFSLLIVLPLFIYSDVVEISENQNVCTVILPGNFNKQHFIFYTFILGFVVPLTVIVISYALIMSDLSLSNKNILSTMQNASKKVIKMVILYVSLFVICWLPFYVIQFVNGFFMVKRDQPPKSFAVLHFLSVCLSYANCAMNPFIHTIIGESFRTHFKRMLRDVREPCATGYTGRGTYSSALGTSRGARHGENKYRNKDTLCTCDTSL
ncbi:somatostatin receptor type 2-like [Saccoglossus kowalevskii]|uniref:Somatostatin receptor type 2-like n=1 Tax=Saccoglossus kowalevskii TaxID=10224 RepID=A0ABM0GY99_SACKO|nr:PREDICTED: somatostatin receptor type 2-like [Saccoglossus kowalevskii]